MNASSKNPMTGAIWHVGGWGNVKGTRVSRRPYEGDGSAGVGVREAQLRFEAEIRDWIGADVVLLYEELDIGQEKDGGEENAMIAVAALALGPPEGPWSFTAAGNSCRSASLRPT